MDYIIKRESKPNSAPKSNDDDFLENFEKTVRNFRVALIFAGASNS